jgi:tryptophan halogenase
LLTNKALVYPLEYTNKREQFHPYTVAKTMKNGWRWITPTQSRIGTGYVFSDKHISVDEARNEFLEDIGDKSIEPFLVDFSPKRNKKAFKTNNCTIGMSSGFLEPLDAPGLCLSIGSIFALKKMFTKFSSTTDLKLREEIIESINYSHERHTMMWTAFILHQYKTCWRNDTKFWQDHKNVQFNLYDEFVERFLVNLENFSFGETMMFSFTKSAKDINWESKTKEKPFPLEQLESKTIHHLDYISSFFQ